jgi:transcriptional regulator
MIIYTPEIFKVTEKKNLIDFIKSYAFATIISSENNTIKHITKIPLLIKIDGDAINLEGHLAINNPHWKFIKLQPHVVVMFDGPHDYVSPTLYSDPVKNVPTWNYSTVIINGKTDIIESNDWLLQSTLELADKYEKNDSWKNNVDLDYAKNISRGIIGLKILVTKIEGKFKLSQNRDNQSKLNVIKHFELTNPELAEEMKKI